MTRGKRKFVLEITETARLSLGELERALSRTASSLRNGRSPAEGGSVRDSAGTMIGTYRWEENTSLGTRRTQC